MHCNQQRDLLLLVVAAEVLWTGFFFHFTDITVTKTIYYNAQINCLLAEINGFPILERYFTFSILPFCFDISLASRSINLIH